MKKYTVERRASRPSRRAGRPALHQQDQAGNGKLHAVTVLGKSFSRRYTVYNTVVLKGRLRIPFETSRSTAVALRRYGTRDLCKGPLTRRQSLRYQLLDAMEDFILAHISGVEYHGILGGD